MLKTNVIKRAQTCTHTQKEKLRHGEFQERIVYEEVCVCVSECVLVYMHMNIHMIHLNVGSDD